MADAEVEIGHQDGDQFERNNGELMRMFFDSGTTNQYHKFIYDALNNLKIYCEGRRKLSPLEELDDRPDNLWHVPISIKEVESFDIKSLTNLKDRFIHFPDVVLGDADNLLNEILTKELTAEDRLLIPKVYCSLFDNPSVVGVNELAPTHVNTVVTLEGVVIRATNVKPLMDKIAFECHSMNANGSSHCTNTELIPIIGGRVLQPNACGVCGRNNLEVSYHKSRFQNRQVLKIQDIKSTTSQWSQNQGIIAFVHDPLIDVAKPGDRIFLTGLYRVNTPRTRLTTNVVKAMCRTFIDVLHIEKIAKVNYSITDDIERNLHGLKDRKKQLELFAPGIEMLDQVKLGLLCSLVGSSIQGGEEAAEKGRTLDRHSIHVLLCGDPATAKSQLLNAVKAVAERCVYVCGRGSSAAGLTASVVRDAESNEYLLEPGAVVVADRGHCLLDEFDKIDENARIVLNEVMEQQTVSVAKAGIVCSLNARATVIGSANPIGSRFDRNRSIMDNINMPLSLLSRFDLVFLLTDPGHTDYDKEISRALLKYWIPKGEKESPAMIHERIEISKRNQALLKSFLTIARHKYHPVIPADVKAEIANIFCQMRMSNRGSIVSARQLKSLIRIAESMAKLEWSDVVTIQHIHAAQRLIHVSNDYLQHKAEDDPVKAVIPKIMHALQERGNEGIQEGELMDLVLRDNNMLDRSVFFNAVRGLKSDNNIISRMVNGQSVIFSATGS